MLYDASIDMASALVFQFGDKSIVHDVLSDRLHMLSTPVVVLLKAISGHSKRETEVLELIKENCFDLLPASEEDSKQYLQLLVSQGILEKTQ